MSSSTRRIAGSIHQKTTLKVFYFPGNKLDVKYFGHVSVHLQKGTESIYLSYRIGEGTVQDGENMDRFKDQEIYGSEPIEIVIEAFNQDSLQQAVDNFNNRRLSDYKLWTNNCAHATKDFLQQIGFMHVNKNFALRPSFLVKEIVKTKFDMQYANVMNNDAMSATEKIAALIQIELDRAKFKVKMTTPDMPQSKANEKNHKVLLLSRLSEFMSRSPVDSEELTKLLTIAGKMLGAKLNHKIQEWLMLTAQDKLQFLMMLQRVTQGVRKLNGHDQGVKAIQGVLVNFKSAASHINMDSVNVTFDKIGQILKNKSHHHSSHNNVYDVWYDRFLTLEKDSILDNISSKTSSAISADVSPASASSSSEIELSRSKNY